MTSDPINLFEQMFAIVGHDEKESKTLAKDLYGAIIQKAILSVFPTLPPHLIKSIEENITQGKSYIDIWDYLASFVETITLEKALTAQSFLSVKEYVKTIEPKLTKDQKERLYSLFAQQI